MKRHLDELLNRPCLDAWEQQWLERLASHPGLIPPDRRQALKRHGLSLARPAPGQPLLLAATPKGGSLWVFSSTGRAGFDEQARAAWTLAARLAARVLPALADPAALEPGGPPKAARVNDGSATLASLNGSSFGLSFFLAHVSRACGVPIPVDLAASAEIRPDGSVGPVDGLPQKIRVLQAWAPGVRRLMVAAEQESEAARIAPEFEILAVCDVHGAWQECFAGVDFDRALAERWKADPNAAALAAKSFLRFTLREPASAIRWKAVGRACRCLVDHPHPKTRWMAQVARAIAERHTGTPRALPPRPDGLRLRRPLRLSLLAQRVQWHNDSASDQWQQVLDEAWREVAREGEEHIEDLKLLGAMGRLLSAWGRYDEAQSVLQRAAEGMIELDEVAEASYSICELFRVGGLQQDRSAVEEAERLARTCIDDPRTTERSRCFLAFARGRARALLGDAEGCRAALADDAATWTEADTHLQATRLRWLARLEVYRTPYLAKLEQMAAAHPDEAGFAWVLARADGGELDALAELSEDDRRLLERCKRSEPGCSTERLLDLFPY